MTTDRAGPTGTDVASGNAAVLTLLRIEWCLPRSVSTVPLARSLLDTTPAVIGVTDGCRAHLALAMTEACANAVRHAHGSDEYRIAIAIDQHECTIQVDDQGIGLHPPQAENTDADRPHPAGYAPEQPDRHPNGHGHGLGIIRVFTDALELRSVRPHGLSVRMRKTLTWKPGQAAAPTTSDGQ
jgi:serine/threonine-protein kinase RsbW